MSGASGDAATRPLTICAIGSSSSTHVAARLRWFAEREHRVSLLTLEPDPAPIEGVTTTVLNDRSVALLHPRLSRLGRILPQPLGGAFHHALHAAELALAIRRCRPDIVHVYSAYDYHGWLVALLGTRPLALTVMGSDVAPFEARNSPARTQEWLTLRLLQAADYITAPSGYLADVVNRLGDFREKSEFVLWGVPLDRFRRRDASDLRRRLGLAPEARIILSPKILRPFYRIHLLVEAMPHVRELCPDAVLVMTEYAADPKYRDQIAHRIEELGLGECAIFVGEIDYADMPTYYSLAEISIAIPPRDAIPHALLESLACETPHILSRLPRYEEIVHHEESAYFVDPDPGSIASGIIRLLEDEALRSTIARQGRRIVREQANIDEHAAHVEGRFRELVATTRPRTVALSTLLPGLVAAARAWLSFQRPRRG